MNGVPDGPLCSLISYVVPPGLSRVPVVGPTEIRPSTSTHVETVSAKNKREISAAPLPEPSAVAKHPSPLTRAPAQVSTALVPFRSSADTSNCDKKLPHSSPVKAQPHQPHPLKKSCLTKDNKSTVVPARFNLKRKTVAFGKTVNVSQTIEGTSRSSNLKRQMNKSASQKTLGDSENKENKPDEPTESHGEQESLLDILKDVKSSLEGLKVRDEERAEELRSIRRVVEEKSKEVDNLRGFLADFFSKDCPRSADSLSFALCKRKPEEEKKSPPRKFDRDTRNRSPQSPRRRRCSPTQKDAGNVIRRDPDRNNVDDISFEEFRRLMATNPTLRQFVLDVRAEEMEQRMGYNHYRKRSDRSDSPWKNRQEGEAVREPRHLEDSRKRGSRGAKFTEKVTVERSIRCSPPEMSKYSVDTRRYIADQVLDDENEASQSMYRPGESVSYYPENLRGRGYAGDSACSDDEEPGVRRNYRDYTTIEERRRHRRERRPSRFQDY